MASKVAASDFQSAGSTQSHPPGNRRTGSLLISGYPPLLRLTIFHDAEFLKLSFYFIVLFFKKPFIDQVLEYCFC